MMPPTLRLLFVACSFAFFLFGALAGTAATVMDAWTVDVSDGIAPATYFSSGLGKTTTTSAVSSLYNGFDGNGVLYGPTYPPAWPFGYPALYEQYISSAVTYQPRNFDLLAPGASLRMQVKAAMAGSLAPGAMFLGVNTGSFSSAMYAGATFGYDFANLSTDPLAASFRSSTSGHFTAIPVDAGVEPNDRWLELDVTATYDKAANQIVLQFNDWQLYDINGNLLMDDALDPAWQGQEVRYDLGFTPGATLPVRPALMGMDHVSLNSININVSATPPLWDDFSLTYVTVPEPAGLIMLPAAALLLAVRRRAGPCPE